MRQLFALAVSCLKLSPAANQLEGRQLEDAFAAAEAAYAAAGALELAGSGGSLGQPADTASSSSSSSRVSSNVACLGVVLRALGLRHAGQIILGVLPAATVAGGSAGSSAVVDEAAEVGSAAAAESPAATPTHASEVSKDAQVSAVLMHLRVCEQAVHGLGIALPAVELPGGPGSEQACAAARQQLLQLQGRLQQDMQDALGNMDSSSSSSSGGGRGSAGVGSSGDGVGSSECGSSSDVFAAGISPDQLQQSSSEFLDAALPGIAQQMVALGEALCAQFPLPHCCNNPGCVELRGASELQLVGGKGCVCGRCR
jgi:hypothetical protein